MQAPSASGIWLHLSDTWLPVDCDGSAKGRVREKSKKNLYSTYVWSEGSNDG